MFSLYDIYKGTEELLCASTDLTEIALACVRRDLDTDYEWQPLLGYHESGPCIKWIYGWSYSPSTIDFNTETPEY